jgi:cell division protein FtsL
MIRLLNICVIVALVAAASYVYKIKFESTRKGEQVARLRLDIRRERDAIADLRAQWSKLDNPVRIQQLAQRHLTLRIIDSHQFDSLDHLPERPSEPVPANAPDPIGNLLDGRDPPTSSIASPRGAR